jgi:hypothetical protein
MEVAILDEIAAHTGDDETTKSMSNKYANSETPGVPQTSVCLTGGIF